MTTILRTKVWHYVLDETGEPIQNAEVRLYLQNSSTTEAIIYATETGGATTCSVADIKTDNDGYFEFWLSVDDYNNDQEFILEWFKAGNAPGYVYDYNPWPNALKWEDENISGEKTTRNKFVSDFLVNKWFTHANAIIPSASPHNIQVLNYTRCSNDIYNKVVSNKFLNDVLTNSLLVSSCGVSGNVYEDLETITSWTSSGSNYYADVTHTTVNGDASVRIIETSTLEEFIPLKIIHLNATTTRILVTENNNVYVSIQGM